MNYFFHGKRLEIPNTLNVITACWKLAEKVLQDEIRSNYPNAEEEAITLLFHGKLANMLREASAEHYIERAFLADLERFFPDLQGSYELRQIANGLVADVSLHKRGTE